MIAADQPTIFDSSKVQCAFSSRDDGTMLIRAQGRHAPQAVENRKKWLQTLGIEYEKVVYQAISYAEGATYNTYALADTRSVVGREPMGLQADAVITATPDISVMLMVADCVAIAVHDPQKQVMASIHAGRHSTVTDIIARTIGAMQRDFGCDPADMLAWLSPNAAQNSYPLDYFDQVDQPQWQDFVRRSDGKTYIDMRGYNRQRLIDAGIRPDSIQVSSVDTVTSSDYFSHSAGDTDGRMAMILTMQP